MAPATMNDSQGDVLVAAIRAIEADSLLTEQQKAKKRQELLSGKTIIVDENGEKNKNENDSDDLLKVLDGSINCSFCMQLPERPVTVCLFDFLYFPFIIIFYCSCVYFSRLHVVYISVFCVDLIVFWVLILIFYVS